MLARALGIAVLVAACGGASPQPTTTVANKPPPPPPVATTCAQAADHVVTFLKEAKEWQQVTLDQARTLLVTRCDQDGWSVELRGCMAGMKQLEDGDQCEHMFTAQQKDNFERDGDQLMKSAERPVEAEPPPPPPTPAAEPAPAPEPKPTAVPTKTRGAKKKPKGAAKMGDPDEGGQ